MIEQELQKKCKQLKPFIGKKADALFKYYLIADTVKCRLKAESLIKIFTSKYLVPRVDDEKILLPPPSREDAEGEFYIGDVVYDDKQLFPLYLRREDLMKHVLIVGASGFGKTTVVYNLILELLKKSVPFLVVDFKRSFRNLRLLKNNRVKEIEVYTIGRKTASPFPFNPLRPPPDVDVKAWIMIVSELLERSHISGQGVADVFIELFDKVFDRTGYYSNKHDKHPNFFDCWEELERSKFSGRRGLWQDSCRRILRTFIYGSGAKGFNSRHPIKLEELLDKYVVIELDQELPRNLRIFTQELILRWVHLYRLTQGESPNLRHSLIFDEGPNLFPQKKIEKESAGGIEVIFREMRSFGQSLVLLAQNAEPIPIEISGNSSTLIYLSLQEGRDIKKASDSLFLSWDDMPYLDLLKVGYGIVKIKGNRRVGPCLVKFKNVPIQLGAVSDDNLEGGGNAGKKSLD